MRHKTVHRNRSSTTALVLTLRFYAQRHALWLVVLSALLIFLFANSQPQAISTLRMKVVEAALPVVAVAQAPVQAMQRAQQAVAAWRDALTQNEALRTANQNLQNTAQAWQQEVLRLQHENTRLRSLLQTPTPSTHQALTVPVVGDAGGSFQQALLALAGINDAVDVGAVALGPVAVVGRVVEIGNRTARILLLTDINSRVPVRLESTGEQAIAAGAGGGMGGGVGGAALLDLKYLPADAQPQVGERVVTSGHGGVFPAGLPVGTVVRTDDGTFAVQLLEQARHLEWVRLLDYKNPADIVSK